MNFSAPHVHPQGVTYLESVTLGDTADVDHLILREDRLDGNLLLEELGGVVDLVCDLCHTQAGVSLQFISHPPCLNSLHRRTCTRKTHCQVAAGKGAESARTDPLERHKTDLATVDLDLHHVSLLLADGDLGNLGVHNDADNLAILLDFVDLLVRILRLVGLLLCVLGKGLLGLGLVPVFVKATAELIGQVLGPYSGERAKAAGGLDVAHDTNNHNRRGLDDGNALNRLLFVQLGAGLFNLADDVSHARFVAHEGGKMAGLGLIIAGEGPDLTLVVCTPLARQEPERSVARTLKLPVRHPAGKQKFELQIVMQGHQHPIQPDQTVLQPLSPQNICTCTHAITT